MIKSIARSAKKAGFTLTEILVAVVVLGVLGGGLAFLAGNVTSSAKTAQGNKNADTLSRIVTDIRAAGGTVTNGTTAGNIKIAEATGGTTIATAAGSTPAQFITELGTGLTVGGINFQVTSSGFTPASYSMGAAPNFTFTYTGSTP